MTGGSRHRLVGRARPLRELEAALRDAVAGHGTLALVTGEAGIGKSRLPRTWPLGRRRWAPGWCGRAAGTMARQPSAGTGTVMRPTTLRRYAVQAGFADVEVLPIEHDFRRFYGLVG